MQQLHTFAVKLGGHQGETGDVPARPREVCSASTLYRIHHYRSDDRDGAVQVDGGGEALYHDDVDRQGHQFCGQLRSTGVVSPGETEFEDDVTAFDIAEVTQALSERIEHRGLVAGRLRQDADARDLRRRLLRQ